MNSRPRHGATESQNGFALLLVLCILAMLAISLMMAAPNLIMNGRREQEKEMIWRGKQYGRAIRLYYQKMNRFPTQLEDLSKPKTGIRFLRQPYKDPMNTVDGSWRLIYLGPSGQLVGSLTQPATQIPSYVPPPTLSTSLLSGALASPKYSTRDPLSAPVPSTKNVNLAGTDSTPSATSPPSTVADSDSLLVNGRIVGVGSKINKSSVIWLHGAKDYRHFEFFWKDATLDSSRITPDP